MNQNHLIDIIEGHTCRARARAIIERDDITPRDINKMISLGWESAGQAGTAPLIAFSAFRQHTTEKTLKGKLIEAYATGYHFGQETALLLEQATPIKISPKGLDGYKRSLRGLIQGFWNGSLTRSEFRNASIAAVGRGLGRAWREGIAKFGFSVDDLTKQEEMDLELAVSDNFKYIDGLADKVEENVGKGGLLGNLTSYSDSLWGNRYLEMQGMGEALAGKDQKAMWVLGIADHCISCLKLAGKVKRYSWWYGNKVLPRVAGAEYLECKGYRCQCQLKATSAAQSPGKMPRLP